MINSIIEAISVALDGEFGDGYDIHMEKIEQDLNEPCFFIQCLNPTNTLFLGKKYFRQNLFCIQYFPESESDWNRECNSVAEILFMCLELLPVEGDLMRGTKMHYEVVDGVLHFFVNYDMYVYKVVEPEPTMEEVSSETLAKG